MRRPAHPVRDRRGRWRTEALRTRLASGTSGLRRCSLLSVTLNRTSPPGSCRIEQPVGVFLGEALTQKKTRARSPVMHSISPSTGPQPCRPRGMETDLGWRGGPQPAATKAAPVKRSVCYARQRAAVCADRAMPGRSSARAHGATNAKTKAQTLPLAQDAKASGSQASSALPPRLSDKVSAICDTETSPTDSPPWLPSNRAMPNGRVRRNGLHAISRLAAR